MESPAAAGLQVDSIDFHGPFLLRDQRFDPSGGHRGHSARNSDAEPIIASSESVDIHKNQYLLSINHAQTSSLC